MSLSPAAALDVVDAWVERHLEFFNPLAWDTAEERDVRRKAFAELSLYLCFRHWCGVEMPRTLCDFVSDITNSPGFLALASRLPAEFLLFAPAMTYPALSGRLGSAARTVIAQMDAEPATSASERVPYRYLDRFFCRDIVLGNREPDECERQGVLALSILSHRLVAGHVTVEDAYALTHSIFYATKFGSEMALLHQRPELRPRTDDIDALICRSLFEQNLDVALELAISRMIVDRSVSPSLALCINAAVDLLEQLGHLPSPPALLEKHDSFPRKLRDWSERYHTTMILGLAAAFVLGHRIDIPRRPEDEQRLLSYGELLSAVFRADVYEASVATAELLRDDVNKLPGARFQLAAVERMLGRHLSLIESSSDPGLLVDAMHLGNLANTPGMRDSMQSVNRLARLVLPALSAAISEKRHLDIDCHGV